MDIPSLSPRRGKGTIRIGDSDDLVLMEHLGALPKGAVKLVTHGIWLLCTEGRAQVDYAGQRIEIKKGDLILYCAHNVAENLLASADFDCKQIWFSRASLWDMNQQGEQTLMDMVTLIKHPKVSLFDDEIVLWEKYFDLLGFRMQDCTPPVRSSVVHMLFGALVLESLAMLRRGIGGDPRAEDRKSTNTMRGRRLVERFIQLLEDCDGRTRRIDDFARQLNVTPKYLARQLKEVSNHTPSEYISMYTAKAIERRLRFTDMTMQEIADDLNFASASFFGRYAKEHLGMTPLEYRKKFHKE